MREWFYPSKRRQTQTTAGLASAPGSAQGQGLGQNRQQGKTVSGNGNGNGNGKSSSSASSAVTGLSPPFHVDTHLALKRMLKAASHGRLPTTPTPTSTTNGTANAGTGTGAYASSSSSGGSGGGGNGNTGSGSGRKDVNTRWSLDGSLSRFAAHALHPYLPHHQQQHADQGSGQGQHQDKGLGSTNSLLRTLQDVADDTSFQAHFDRMRQPPSNPQSYPHPQSQSQQEQQHDDAHTATEESKQSYAHPLNTPTTPSTTPTAASSTSIRGRTRLADTGHFSPSPGAAAGSSNNYHSGENSEGREGRVYKQRARSTNSNHMDSVLSAHEQVGDIVA